MDKLSDSFKRVFKSEEEEEPEEEQTFVSEVSLAVRKFTSDASDSTPASNVDQVCFYF